MGGWLAGNANTLWGSTFVSILVLSLLPADAPKSEIGSSWVWNFGHIPAYAALGGLTALALSRRGPVNNYTRIRAAAIVVAMAVVLELLQPLVGRSASMTDVGSGVFGTFIGMGMHALLAGKRTPKGNTHNGFR